MYVGKKINCWHNKNTLIRNWHYLSENDALFIQNVRITIEVYHLSYTDI
jgi:hypothetical protein